MTLVKYSPNRGVARNFFDDTLVRDFFGGLNSPRYNGVSGHRFNVNKTEDGFQITAALPGVKREELTLEVTEGVLAISYKHAEGEENANRFVSEFTQRYQLGDSIDQDSIEAGLADGVLTVKLKRLPEPEAAKPRAIEIK